MKRTKVVVFIVVFLLAIIIGELAFYFSLKPTTNKTVVSKGGITNARQSLITDDEAYAFKNDPQGIFRAFFQDDATYLRWRKQMGVDIDSWIALSTYDKDCLDSLILFRRLKGTVTKKTSDASSVRFVLKGPTGSTMTIYENSEGIKIAKVVKEVNGTEKPSTMNEIKDGDFIIIEARIDMQKPADDPLHYIDKKYIILQTK